MKICYEVEELGRRLLLLLLVLLLLVLFLLLEEGGRPQPLLLLLWAECRFWVRSTAGITLTLKRKVENEKNILHSRPKQKV